VAQPEEDRYVVTSLYVPGVSKKLRWQLKKLGVDLVFKRGQTLGSMICNVKEKRTAERQKGVIYKIPCQHCQECYTGKICRHWGTRRAEHQGYVQRGEADKSGPTMPPTCCIDMIGRLRVSWPRKAGHTEGGGWNLS